MRQEADPAPSGFPRPLPRLVSTFVRSIPPLAGIFLVPGLDLFHRAPSRTHRLRQALRLRHDTDTGLDTRALAASEYVVIVWGWHEGLWSQPAEADRILRRRASVARYPDAVWFRDLVGPFIFRFLIR